jgi:hypothetical protein
MDSMEEQRAKHRIRQQQRRANMSSTQREKENAAHRVANSKYRLKVPNTVKEAWRLSYKARKYGMFMDRDDPEVGMYCDMVSDNSNQPDADLALHMQDAAAT